MENRIFGLMKIGAYQYMDRLFREGEIYMRPLSYFQKLEDDKQRSDTSEGSLSLDQVVHVELINPIEGITIEFSNAGVGYPMLGNGKVRSYDKDCTKNVYCLYGFSRSLCQNTNVVDPKNYEFGDTAVLIHNAPAFIARVKQAISELQLLWESGVVRYYDEDTLISENLTPFDKPQSFKHQSEYRILVYSNTYDSLTLKIGSMDDIAEIHPIENIKRMTFKAEGRGGRFFI